MNATDIQPGQIYQDNDPRMKERRVRIIRVLPNGASYQPCDANGRGTTHRTYTALARRFYDDGKPRKSGFSLIVS